MAISLGNLAANLRTRKLQLFLVFWFLSSVVSGNQSTSAGIRKCLCNFFLFISFDLSVAIFKLLNECRHNVS